MKRLVLVILLSGFAIGNGFAQKISVVKATEEKWSGGVVGRSGVNYSINLKVEKGNIAFDSVYINGRGYSLDKENISSDSAKRKFSIKIAEVHWARPNPVNPNQQEQEYKGPMRSFDGRALVVYTYKKKKHLLLVKEISALPPKMYP